MITLNELGRLARRSFAGEPPDAVRILYAWVENDPGAILGQALMQVRSSRRRFNNALRPLLDARHPEEVLMVRHCQRLAGPGADTRLLLNTLAERPNHRIVSALSRDGIDLLELAKKLDQLEPASEADAPVGARESDDLRLYGVRLQEPADELLKFGRDLTALAREGAFTGLFERETELELLTEILLRKNKPNVAITGPAGTGKTALVETFAVRLARGTVPSRLKDARLFAIDMGALVAGTRYRGDFEQRLNLLLSRLQSIKSAILFIDEMHLIAGAGAAEGVVTDAANIMKPYLARGEIRVIGATTHDEFHRYIAKDKALTRRFQEVKIAEPATDTVHQMVASQAAVLAMHHRLHIDPGLLATAIDLGSRFFPNRFQPDKSIDLLDITAARLSLHERTRITERDLLETIARQTGQSVGNLTSTDQVALSSLTDRLKERVVGQAKAVSKVSDRLIQQGMGLTQPDRCRAVFLFAGDTGVGKTSLAKAIGEALFPGKDSVLTIDLGEFSQPGSVNNLIGVPRGHQGMDEEGLLSGWLRERSEGVLILDEIEKAHPDVHRLLLGLLDHGRIRDPRGNVIEGRQHVIVLTTNALTPEALRRQPMGFRAQKAHLDPFDLLTAEFPAEFLGRIDEIVLFDPLCPNAIRRIVQLQLLKAVEGLAERGIVIEFDEGRVTDRISEAGDIQRLGARGIDRTVERLILQPIARLLLSAPRYRPLTIHLSDNGCVIDHKDPSRRVNDPLAVDAR